MSGHTPGPWTHAHDGHGAFSIETDNCDGLQICYVRNRDNARLIAAAPELLEALDKLASGYLGANWDTGLQDRIRNARAAIAKATGGQP